jgi:phage replication-related protein YjqB (UPF0714/DUF867 family)
MTSPYASFSELVFKTTKDVDYRLAVHQPSQEMALVAIHGGAVEPLTGELATAVAGDDYSRYVFEGLRPSGNDALRIPVTRYDEMRLRALLERSLAALSLDGVPGEQPIVHLGGSNRALKELVSQALEAAGFATGRLVTPGGAHDPARFYNWPQRGGLHLELTQALRQSLVDRSLAAPGWQEPAARNARFALLVATLREALAVYLAAARSGKHHQH